MTTETTTAAHDDDEAARRPPQRSTNGACSPVDAAPGLAATPSEDGEDFSVTPAPVVGASAAAAPSAAAG
jgi:hypothetical protein